VFSLMFTAYGTGLGMSYSEVMNLEVSTKDELLQMLHEQIEALNDEMNSRR
jgi:hypothetical protein